MVGARGFEPPTPTTPLWCATRLRYAPTVDAEMPAAMPQTRDMILADESGEKRRFSAAESSELVQVLYVTA